MIIWFFTIKLNSSSANEDPRTQCPHHHPKFDFDERALLHIATMFLKIVAYYADIA